MMYSNISELIARLKKEDLWAKKGLGQNFLVNKEALDTIVRAADIKPTDRIIEIGPGMGILTNELIQRALEVMAIEVDARLIPILEKQFEDAKNLTIVLQDALTLQLPNHPYKVVANIPYYITSPLLNHFLQPHTGVCAPAQSRHGNQQSRSDTLSRPNTPQRPDLIVLLVQKEVAEKICSKDGDHSVLSLQVQIFGKPEIVGIVGKNSFFPTPKVDSAIIKITPHPQPLITNLPFFFRIIKGCFSQRRKTLHNSLRTAGYTKEQAEQCISDCGFKPTARPQELTVADWETLLNRLEKESAAMPTKKSGHPKD